MRGMRPRGALPIGFLIALLVFYFREALFTEKVLYFRDLFSLFIPERRLITTMVGQGIPPWWNPYLFSGVPLAADVVHGIFYPVSALFYVLPVHWAFKLFVVLHYLIAGGAFFVLMREWKLSSMAATLGSVSFMLSGYLLSLSNVLNFLPGAAWLPLGVAFFIRALEKAEWRWVFPVGVVLALEAVTDPQNVYFSVCLMALWAVLPGERPWSRDLLRALGMMGAAGVIAALLAAAQLLPLAELLPRSIRSEGVSLTMSVIWSFRPSRLVEFLTPHLYGDVIRGTYWGWIFQREQGSATPWLLSAYMGVPPLVLAGAATIFGWRDRRVYFCLFVLVLSLVLALGDSTPLYPLFYQIVPFFKLFRFPSKWLLLATWALAALAAIGLAHVMERSLEERRRVRRFIVAGLIGALGLAVALLFVKIRPDWLINLLSPYFPPSDVPLLASYVRTQIIAGGLVAVGLLVATLLLLSSLLRRRLSPRLVQGALLVLLTADVAVHNAHLIPLAPRELLEGDPPLARVLKSDRSLFRVYRLETREEDETILGQGKSIFDLAIYRWRLATLYVNTGMEHGLSELWGSSAVRLTDYQRVFDLMAKNPLNLRLLGAWNVKYLIVPMAELRHPLLEPVPIPGGDPRVHLYRNLDYLPRAVWVSRARWVADGNQALVLLGRIDPSQEVLLEGAGEQPVEPGAPSREAARVEIISYKPHEVIITCEAPRSGHLVLSDTYYPGWRAMVDGRPRPLLRANYAMRAVQLEAGAHEVRFRYEPGSVRLGGIVSLLALVGVGGIMIATFWQRR